MQLLTVPLLAFAMAAGLACALTAAGARVRVLLRLPLHAGLRLGVDFLIGSWMLAVLALLLSACHLWRPWALVAMAAGLAIGGRWRGNGWRWAGLAFPALAAAVALPVALAPPFFFDAWVYHLGLPWQALLERGFHPHPEDLFSAFPPLAQCVAAMPLSVGADRVPALLHWWSFVAAGLAAAGLARSLGAPRWSAAMAAACVPLLPGHALLPGVPAAEGWTVAGVLAAFAVMLRSRVVPGASLLAGLLLGIASAARLQGLSWSVMALALVWLRGFRRLRPCLQFIIGWAIGSFPWWAKNLVLLGNPIAPLGWRREGIETLWRDAGSVLLTGGRLSPALAAIGHDVLPHLSYLGPLLLAALLAWLTYADPRRRLVTAVALGGALAWFLTGTSPRFLTPTLGIVLASVAATPARAFGRLASALAFATTIFTGLVFNVGELRRVGGFALLASRPEQVWQKWLPNNPVPAFAAAKRLPLEAKVLFVGQPQCFLFPRRFVAPSQHDVSPLRGPLERLPSVDAVRHELERRGITHLLVNWGELGRLSSLYPVAPWRDAEGFARWRGFLQVLGAPVIAVGGTAIYEVTRPPG